MIEFLIWATAYLATGGFCAQICYGKSKGACSKCTNSYTSCEHGVWYWASFLGFFLPMIMVGVLLAKKSGLDLTQKERYEQQLEAAKQRTELAEEEARELRVRSHTRVEELDALRAEVESLNQVLEQTHPGMFKPIPTSDLG